MFKLTTVLDIAFLSARFSGMNFETLHDVSDSHSENIFTQCISKSH